VIIGVGIPEDVLDAILCQYADDPLGVNPVGQLRLGASLYLDCLLANSRHGQVGPADTALGVQLVLDEHLPANAWRLCTVGGDLIRDSREARP
jgi:hypothetical protein